MSSHSLTVPTPLRPRWTSLVKSALAAAVVLGTLSAGQAQAATNLSKQFGFGGKIYLVYTSDAPINWVDARAYARGLSSNHDLASINSAAENTAIFNQINDAAIWDSTFGPWIGLQNTSWVDGTTIASNGFSAWAPGQPDNSGGIEQYGGYTRDSGNNRAAIWNDFSFYATTRSFVVEAPGPVPLLGIAAVFGFSRKLRKRIKNSANRGSSSSTI